MSTAVARLVRDATRAAERDEDPEGTPATRERRAALFRRRVEAGEYRALIDPRLRQVLEEAAAERGLAEELGALRVVLMRLLVEEDLDKLARNVSRIAAAAARVRRVQEQVGEESAAELQRFVDQIAEALARPGNREPLALGEGASGSEGEGRETCPDEQGPG